jgi:hypothetical protein
MATIMIEPRIIAPTSARFWPPWRTCGISRIRNVQKA